jgi:hypothetical protein
LENTHTRFFVEADIHFRQEAQAMNNSMEEFLARMRAQGKERGSRIREEQGRPPMPEPVCEGSTKKSEEQKTAEFRVWEFSTMVKLGFYHPDPEDAGKVKITKTLLQFLAGT